MALAAPFLSSLREARGQETTPPKRLVIFFTANGCITDRWWPELEDGALGPATFDGTTLEALNPYYKKLLLPRGFRSMNAFGTGQTIDPHAQATGSKLTCAPIDPDTWYATGESLDHAIAKQINPNAAAPLVLSVGRSSVNVRESLSFSAPGTPFPAEVDPRAVYESLTGLVPGASPEADYRLRRGESIIDFVRDDLEEFQRLDMSRADRGRIETWLDLLRDTEVGMGKPACDSRTAELLGVTTAALEAAAPVPDDEGRVDLATAFTLGGDMMMNLMALSMICDANRSLILKYPGFVTFDWDGIHHVNDHAGLAYRTGSSSIGGMCLANVIDLLLQIDRWYAGKFARLVGLLDRIDEGNGTLLDNTATLWLPELSDGAAFNLNNLPILIAGSAGGYLRQGAAVNVEGAPIGLGNSSRSCDGGVVGASGSEGGNVPINKLYATLMNAVGCTADGTPEGGKVARFGLFDGIAVDSGITQPGEVTALTAG